MLIPLDPTSTHRRRVTMTSRFRRSSVRLALVAFCACTSCAKSEDTFPITIEFGPHGSLFWCGHGITSPAVCTFERDTLFINGFGPQPPPPRDTVFTVEQDRRLCDRFETVPMVMRLHRQGYSCANAVRLWFLAKDASFRRVIQSLAASRGRPRAERLSLIRSGLDDELVDLNEPVLMDETSVTMTLRGGRRESIPIASGGPSKPVRKRPPIVRAIERVRMLEHSLRVPTGEVVVFADPGGTHVLLGKAATDARDKIEELLDMPSVDVRDRVRAATGIVPEEAMRQIIVAREGSKESKPAR